jgi:preprotein translocase subunit YajC
MNSRKALVSALAVLLLLVSAGTAFAHNGVEHILGTITAVTENSITVDTPKHTSVTVVLDRSTTFTNNDVKSSLKDLKVGDRVVINAKANMEKKLVAVTVKSGAKSTAHSGQK